MPKRRPGKQPIGFSSDFTINDYANASTVHSRSKKNIMLQTTVDWDWDENVDDDIDLVEIENENGTKVFVAQRVCSQKNIFRNYSLSESESEGVTDYPLDIWFQISRYIAPEDVGRFAGICHATLAVTRSANFWFSMYRRYYKRKSKIPMRLQPEQMKLRYGLRSCVIRCLFFTYTPMVIQAHISNFYTPKELLKRKCLSLWYKKQEEEHWVFFFKLKLVDYRILRNRHTEETHKKSVFDILDDVMANPEDDCKILKVYCESFLEVPPVMGMILNVIFKKVSSDMRHSNLYLGFSQTLQDNVKMQEYNMTLNSIINMEVLDWWHPDYPHSEGFLPSSIVSNSTKLINPADYNILF